MGVHSSSSVHRVHEVLSSYTDTYRWPDLASPKLILYIYSSPSPLPESLVSGVARGAHRPRKPSSLTGSRNVTR